MHLNPNIEIRNPKQIQNTNSPNKKKFDLEERTLIFAYNTREFIRSLPKTLTNIEDAKQLTRSSGSVGANYIEANEALSKKDFCLHVKICRKEAKESIYWLKLIYTTNIYALEKDRQILVGEATELMKIFGAIIEKSR